jgi:hypothetical protein
MKNYNTNANRDDGTCIPIILGCTDFMATNFNPQATVEDGTCDINFCRSDDHNCRTDANEICMYLGPGMHECTCAPGFILSSQICEVAIYGCTDSTASNYNLRANMDMECDGNLILCMCTYDSLEPVFNASTVNGTLVPANDTQPTNISNLTRSNVSVVTPALPFPIQFSCRNSTTAIRESRLLESLTAVSVLFLKIFLNEVGLPVAGTENFNCSLIFSSLLRQGKLVEGILESSICTWQNDVKLLVTGNIWAHDYLTLHSQCSNMTQVAIVQRPRLFHPPQARIIAPLVLGPCASLYLDGTESTFTRMMRVKWGWSEENKHAGVQDVLREASAENKLMLILPVLQIAGSVYTFQLTLSIYDDVLQLNSTDVHTVTLTSDIAATVALKASQVTVYAFQPTVVEADIFVPVCESLMLSVSSVSYFWSVIEGELRDDSGLQSQAKSSSKLFLPSFSLFAGALGKITLQVSVNITLQSGALMGCTNSIALYASPGPILTKLVPFSEVRSVGRGEILMLDATASVDTDNPEQGSLLFAWRCLWVPSWYACPGVPELPSATDSIVSFEAAEMLVGPAYMFFCKISSRDGSKQANISLSIHISQYQIPAIALSVSARGEAVSMVNVGDTITLAAWVQPRDLSKVSLIWSSVMPDSRFTSVDIDRCETDTPSSQHPNSAFLANLMVPPSVMAQGLRYVFRLDASPQSGGTAFATFAIATNDIPTGGSIHVTPGTGTALQTVFVVYSRGWEDQHLPLLSRFSYVGSTSRTPKYLTNFGEDDSLRTLLPSGGTSNGFRFQIVVELKDVYEAVAFASTSVTVAPNSELGASTLGVDRVKAMLQTASASKSPQLPGLLEVIAAHLNTANTARRQLGEDGDDVRGLLMSELNAMISSIPNQFLKASDALRYSSTVHTIGNSQQTVLTNMTVRIGIRILSQLYSNSKSDSNSISSDAFLVVAECVAIFMENMVQHHTLIDDHHGSPMDLTRGLLYRSGKNVVSQLEFPEHINISRKTFKFHSISAASENNPVTVRGTVRNTLGHASRPLEAYAVLWGHDFTKMLVSNLYAKAAIRRDEIILPCTLHSDIAVVWFASSVHANTGATINVVLDTGQKVLQDTSIHNVFCGYREDDTREWNISGLATSSNIGSNTLHVRCSLPWNRGMDIAAFRCAERSKSVRASSETQEIGAVHIGVIISTSICVALFELWLFSHLRPEQTERDQITKSVSFHERRQVHKTSPPVWYHRKNRVAIMALCSRSPISHIWEHVLYLATCVLTVMLTSTYFQVELQVELQVEVRALKFELCVRSVCSSLVTISVARVATTLRFYAISVDASSRKIHPAATHADELQNSKLERSSKCFPLGFMCVPCMQCMKRGPLVFSVIVCSAGIFIIVTRQPAQHFSVVLQLMCLAIAINWFVVEPILMLTLASPCCRPPATAYLASEGLRVHKFLASIGLKPRKFVAFGVNHVDDLKDINDADLTGFGLTPRTRANFHHALKVELSSSSSSKYLKSILKSGSLESNMLTSQDQSSQISSLGDPAGLKLLSSSSFQRIAETFNDGETVQRRNSFDGSRAKIFQNNMLDASHSIGRGRRNSHDGSFKEHRPETFLSNPGSGDGGRIRSSGGRRSSHDGSFRDCLPKGASFRQVSFRRSDSRGDDRSQARGTNRGSGRCSSHDGSFIDGSFREVSFRSSASRVEGKIYGSSRSRDRRNSHDGSFKERPTDGSFCSLGRGDGGRVGSSSRGRDRRSSHDGSFRDGLSKDASFRQVSFRKSNSRGDDRGQAWEANRGSEPFKEQSTDGPSREVSFREDARGRSAGDGRSSRKERRNSHDGSFKERTGAPLRSPGRGDKGNQVRSRGRRRRNSHDGSFNERWYARPETAPSSRDHPGRSERRLVTAGEQPSKGLSTASLQKFKARLGLAADMGGDGGLDGGGNQRAAGPAGGRAERSFKQGTSFRRVEPRGPRATFDGGDVGERKPRRPNTANGIQKLLPVAAEQQRRPTSTSVAPTEAEFLEAGRFNVTKHSGPVGSFKIVDSGRKMPQNAGSFKIVDKELDQSPEPRKMSRVRKKKRRPKPAQGSQPLGLHSGSFRDVSHERRQAAGSDVASVAKHLGALIRFDGDNADA